MSHIPEETLARIGSFLTGRERSSSKAFARECNLTTLTKIPYRWLSSHVEYFRKCRDYIIIVISPDDDAILSDTRFHSAIGLNFKFSRPSFIPQISRYLHTYYSITYLQLFYQPVNSGSVVNLDATVLPSTLHTLLLANVNIVQAPSLPQLKILMMILSQQPPLTFFTSMPKLKFLRIHSNRRFHLMPQHFQNNRGLETLVLADAMGHFDLHPLIAIYTPNLYQVNFAGVAVFTEDDRV